MLLRAMGLTLLLAILGGQAAAGEIVWLETEHFDRLGG
jgi:hypothetical protein